MLARNGHRVHLLCRTDAEAEGVNAARRVARATHLTLDDAIEATGDPRCTASAAMTLLVVPSQSVRENARRRVETEFRTDLVVPRYEALYRRTLERRG